MDDCIFVSAPHIERFSANLCAQQNRNCAAKRFIDLAFGLPLLLAALPVIGLLAILVKFISPGPAFFVQEREGLDGKPIRIRKLRSMHADADARLRRHFDEHPEREAEWMRFYKLDNDPRVIPFLGTLLRKCSLDELPQLFNVVRGDMSLVGPRPFPYSDLSTFEPGFRRLRQTVRPGLTGLWQIKRGGNDAKVALDTWYVRNWSLRLDAGILLRTVPVVLFGKKANY